MPSSLVWAIAEDRDGYLWLRHRSRPAPLRGVRFVSRRLAARCRPRTPSGAHGLRPQRWWRLDRFWRRQGRRRLSSTAASPAIHHRAACRHESCRCSKITRARCGPAASWDFNFRDGSWTPLPASSGLPVQASVFGVYEDSANTLWVSTSVGAFRRQAGVAQFEAVEIATRVCGFAEDGAGKMWIVGARPWMPTTPRRGRNRSPAGACMRDRHGSLWIATVGDGVWRITTDRNGHETARTLGRPRRTDQRCGPLAVRRSGRQHLGRDTERLESSLREPRGIDGRDRRAERGGARGDRRGRRQRLGRHRERGLSVPGRETPASRITRTAFQAAWSARCTRSQRGRS